jgi:hypothetical protein
MSTRYELKLTPDLAEHSGLIWVQRWIDVS